MRGAHQRHKIAVSENHQRESALGNHHGIRQGKQFTHDAFVEVWGWVQVE